MHEILIVRHLHYNGGRKSSRIRRPACRISCSLGNLANTAVTRRLVKFNFLVQLGVTVYGLAYAYLFQSVEGNLLQGICVSGRRRILLFLLEQTQKREKMRSNVGVLVDCNTCLSCCWQCYLCIYGLPGQSGRLFHVFFLFCFVLFQLTYLLCNLSLPIYIHVSHKLSLLHYVSLYFICRFSVKDVRPKWPSL